MSGIAVFCGSSDGARAEYAAAARSLGRALATGGHEIVYGGGRTGLMGVLADAALAAGGRVTGIMPRLLQGREVGHTGLSRLIVVETMHDRKREMAALADGFAVLPGGFGTLDEMFEILTWAQLGLHTKPCALLNVCGYFAPLLQLLDRAVEEGFVREPNRRLLQAVTTVEELLTLLTDR